MTFKAQLQADLSVFFNTDEFAEAAVLTTSAGDFDVKIVRMGAVDLISGGPGQTDSDTFDVCKATQADEITIPPGSYFTLADESVWVVQTGVRLDEIAGTWTCPVLSDGRVKA